jgi:hypothetical protein
MKSRIKEKIKRTTADSEGGQDSPTGPKRKAKKLANVYLVNKVKFHSVVDDEDLEKELSADNLDEKAHQIIMHKIR